MTIKEKVQTVQQICGTIVNLTDPMVTEIMASLGYDFIWVDMEHTTLTTEQVYHHLLAAKAAGTPVFVRVPADDLTVTKQVLEMGIDGIIFPMVQDAKHAKELLAHTLYPPYGTRGFGPRGAVRYGLDNEKEYCAKTHLNLCRFIQIEQKSAAEDAEEIVKIPYLDGCIFGMNDLSGSVGRLGDVFCKETMELVHKTVKAFQSAGKTIGAATFATDKATMEHYRQMGVNMFAVGADYEYILKNAQKTLETFCETIKES